MTTKKILFPTDFSDGGRAALEYASALASEYRSLLLIVHVDELADLIVPGFGLEPAGYAFPPEQNQSRHEVQAKLEQVLPTVRGVKFDHRYLRGSPAEEILACAEREGVDLIVIGTHGRTGLARLLMGSVAESVVRRAKCPVLTVKQPIGEAEEAADS